MPGEVDFGLVLAYTVGLIVVYLLLRLLWLPARLLLRCVYALCLGTLALLAFNLVGRPFALHVPFNLVSVLGAGFLGLPGIVLLLALKTLF